MKSKTLRCYVVIMCYCIGITISSGNNLEYRTYKKFSVSHTKNGIERPILQAPLEVAVAASKSRVVIDDLEWLDIDSLPAKVTASSAKGNENAPYLLSSSAYALRKGEGRYQNIMGLVNHVSYGFSNHFSCGIGMFPIFIFEAESVEDTPIWLTPKYTFTNPNSTFNFSVGALAVALPFAGKDVEGYAAYPYVVGTFGKASQNVSVGAGWTFSKGRGGTYIGKTPTINISGIFGVDGRNYFLFDNFFTFATNEDFISSFNLVSIAYRYSGKSFSLDLGIVVPLTEELEYTVTVLPWIGVSVPFGKTN